MRPFRPSPATRHAYRYLAGLLLAGVLVFPGAATAADTSDTSALPHTGDTGLPAIPPPPGGLGIIINEVLADPDGDGVEGDANCDGVRDATDDEFIEIVNISGAPFDLTGWGLKDSDGAGADHVFGALILQAGEAVVVFGGGTPTFDGTSGNPEPWCTVALPPQVHFETASSGGFNLDGGGGDEVRLLNPEGVVVYTLDYDNDDASDGRPDGDNNTSMVRITELDPTSQYGDHDELALDFRRQSPGTFRDGGLFCLATYWADADGDGFGDPAFPSDRCAPGAGFATNDGDCDDTNPDVHPGAIEVCDGLIDDCDDRPGAVPAIEVDDDGDGYVECSFAPGDWLGPDLPTGGLDCDDTDGTRFPGAPDLCDGLANDCDGGAVTPDEIDNDGDGYVECAIDAGGWDGDIGVIEGLDCNDGDATLFPSAPELCDGLINNCDTLALPVDEIDDDGDGYVECTFDPGGWDGDPSVIGGGDCDDTPGPGFDVGPGVIELCDGVINGCALDELADDEVDNDVDGYVECTIDPGGWFGDPAVVGGDDCNDIDPTVSPVGVDLCDGIVNTCGGSLIPEEIDDDGDGFVDCTIDAGGWDGAGPFFSGGDDCDDVDPTVFPGAVELCDGIVNACGGALPANEIDDDGDGHVECVVDAGGWDNLLTVPISGVDCNDADPTVFPGADELCDGIVTDCDLDGELPATEADRDGDGWIECTEDRGGWRDVRPSGFEDCDDDDPTVFPTAPELCDGIDNNCDLALPSDEIDGDFDNYVECAFGFGEWRGLSVPEVGIDCDDTDDTVFPSALERCDGQRNDCDAGPGVPADEVDNDGDGYVECPARDIGGWDGLGAVPVGYLDCDDTDDTVYPTAPETCDGRNTDCNLAGVLPLDEVDNDGDGYVECPYDIYTWVGVFVFGGLDCNDADDTIRPFAPELCDGQDNSCDEVLPVDEIDNDGDGYVDCVIDPGGWDVPATRPIGGADCDDTDVTVYPGGVDLCDGLINDCNDAVLRDVEIDDDGDGYVECVIDPDGWNGDPAVIGGGDCDDSDPSERPDGLEACDGQANSCGGGPVPADEVDNDGDGYIECAFTPGVDTWLGDADEPLGGGDCNDVGPDAASVFPGAPELCDGIINTCGGALPIDETDVDGDSFVACTIDADGWDGVFVPIDGDDCNPTDGTVYPGAPPLCDGLINDCDIDFLGPEELDNDGDGFVECVFDAEGWDGDDSPTIVVGGGDCRDEGARAEEFYPEAPPLCDGLVNDCLLVSLPDDEVDNDGDGYVDCTIVAEGWLGVVISGGDDCDDGDDTVFPTAPALCDGLINDCDAGALSDFEIDDDGDGYVECTFHREGWDGDPAVVGGGDCRDEPLLADPRSDQFYPTAPELCDGIANQDCSVDDLATDESDDDGDGYVECAFGVDPARDSWLGDPSVFGGNDCEDDDASVYPTAPFLCDGIINDCGPALDAREVDHDGDRYVECTFDIGGWDGILSVRGGGDCEPFESSIYPSAPELCDGLANDCRLLGAVPLNEIDNDGDGHVECSIDPSGWDGDAGVDAGDDCVDSDATIFPGAPERCDGLDNDCDLVVPLDEGDNDFDGHVECEIDAGGWDGAGPGTLGGDCDDTDPTVSPGAVERCDGQDNDCDGMFAELGVDGFDEVDDDGDRFVDCEIDAGGWDGAPIGGGADCDDTDTTVYPGAAERCDGIVNNCDTPALPLNEIDNDGDAHVECIFDPLGWDGDPGVRFDRDCNDTDASVWPFAPELCDGQRNDCNDAALGIPERESDLDRDGYVACTIDDGGWDGPGSPDGSDDCDDLDNTVYPGADQLCDGQRNDCAEALPGELETDHDRDFFVECEIDAGGWDGDAPVVGGNDCEPFDETVFPGAVELCDGRDNDCGETPGPDERELDDDGDGYVECGRDPGGWTEDFFPTPTGYDDCDDEDPLVNPGAIEICDGRDNDCGVTPDMDPTEYDHDGDGYIECALARPAWIPDFFPTPTGYEDCDDDDATIHPSAPELCDGQDNDCSVPDDPLAGLSASAPDEIDDDGDGFVSCTVDVGGWDGPVDKDGDDCNDADPTVFPGATELCDGQDNDCDLALDPSEDDLDGDNFVECDFAAEDWVGDPRIQPGDCNPLDDTVQPGAPERCDGQDNDCDGEQLDIEQDLDDDGFVACGSVDLDLPEFDDPREWDLLDDWDGGPILGGNDCWPLDDSRFPGAADGCFADIGDGIDNDCDGTGGDTFFNPDLSADTDDDGDGLTYDMELDLDTDDCDIDSDGDGLQDGYEWCISFDPSRDDMDGDSISDGCEYLPELEDVECSYEHDSLCDIAGMYPDPPPPPVEDIQDTDGDGTFDAMDEDDDGDLVPTAVEILQAGGILGNTDGADEPNVRDDDDDNDFVPTFFEVTHGTNHLNIDSDGDLKEDLEEWLNYMRGVPGSVDKPGIVCGLSIADLDLDDHCSDLDGGESGTSFDDPWDRDSDGIINALDDDDDGDGLNLIQELRDEGPQAVECIPENEDGIPPTYDFDTDGDGRSDSIEGLGDE
ncbi:MAG: hypothetical protein ACI8PZ_006193, partial [Myxococcota bacterium]